MSKENEAVRVQELLKKYGYHSQSYNILRNDKSYFYSSAGFEGAIAYVVKSTKHLLHFSKQELEQYFKKEDNISQLERI
jgi:lysylphosphatidylglycerol synthetase-like protein (DUF2156 family)